MKQKIFIIFLILILCGVLTVGGVFFWWNQSLSAPSKDATKVTVTIAKGSSGEAIGEKLFANGVIKNELAFKLYLRINNLASKIPVGQFEIPKNLTVAQVIEVLQKGPTLIWVTVPEGLRHEQLPDRFISALNLSGEKADAFYTEFLTLAEDEEGYLYPDTYLIPKDLKAPAAVNLLKTTFQKKYQALTKNTPIPLTDNEIVTLASLIERETLKGPERPMVAGILYNRLAIGMPLQVDATVQYTLANMRCRVPKECEDWWPTVLLGDYTIKSAYSTYAITGLPPSPIANPGITALEAAANPTKSDYIYYLHDRNGGIHYAKTLAEHNQNVQQYIN